jgi:VWFA-related protein
MRPLVPLLLCALAVSAQQPGPVPVEAQVYVTVIDVIADVRDAAGRLPAGLTPDDFILIEDGVERKVIGVDYLRAERPAAAQPGAAVPAPAPVPSASPARPWQTVLYFETDLSNGRGRKRTANELSKHADRLVQMGTVDVIFANPRPVSLLRNSRDAEAVRKALNTVAASGGVNQLALHRAEFLRFAQSTTQLEAIKAAAPQRVILDISGKPVEQPRTSNMATIATVDGKVVRPYIEQEVQLVGRFRRNLIAWLSNYGRYAPRTLVLVTDGYDLDPLEYYSSYLDKSDQLELRGHVAQAGLSDSSAKMAKSLATAGWMTMSVQGDTLTDGWIDDASTNSVGRIHKSSMSQPQSGPRAILLRPVDPLREVAEETGGDVVVNPGRIAEALERIEDRLRITYQVDRKPDGKPLKIELRARDKNLKVRSARWASSATPDEMAEQRALAQLHDGAFIGDLQVEATVEWTPNSARRQGTLRVVSKLPDFIKGTKGDFRFTLAVLVPPNESFVVNRQLAGYQLTNGEFRLRTPLDLPPATSVVVISIEEMSTGMWGSARIKVP